MHYRFAKQRLTESAGSANELISGRLQLKHFYLKFEDTGFMKVEVIPQGANQFLTNESNVQNSSTYEFTSLLGTIKERVDRDALVGSVNLLSTGTFKVPVMTRADKVTIDVKNNSFLPTNLTSAEYEAFFYIRSNRR